MLRAIYNFFARASCYGPASINAIAPAPQPAPAIVQPPRPASATFMVPWSAAPSKNPPARYRLLMNNTDRTPRGVADYLFNTNRVSDEYYTQFTTWRRFLYTRDTTRYWEPFYGDGSGVAGLRDAGYDIVGSPGNFWDIDWTTAPTDPILSNPPFSFKWLVIEALLKNRREFHLILPWQTFHKNTGGADKLRRLQQVYGGTYSEFKLTHNECNFIMPSGSTKKIGCLILSWHF